MFTMIILSLLLILVNVSEACTSLAIGRDATVSGLEAVVTHTMDESNNDFRFVSVPAKDHEPGSMRPIYKQNEHYPRLVSNNSSKSYRPTGPHQKLSEPIGYIPQINHTYGRYEASYASMNEMGLSVTESTCGAKTIASALPKGKALFWIGELSQIALERCATVRCAIDTMGELAVKHGFYGEQEVEGSGETLLLADTNESWVFSILSSPCGSSAVWCAQRVPDDHVTVVANMYTIRNVDLNDSSTFRYSENMLDVAREQKWWNGSLPFDFTRAFSSGEYGHPYYTGRRVWRVLSLMAPSLNLDATLGVRTDRATYPWSVKAEKKVSLSMLRELNRDHYEDTPYDLTKGMAAGPFNSPNRLDGGSRFFPQPKGAWERPIAMYRTSYSLIAAPRDSSTTSGGVIFYAPHNPHASVYVPFFQVAAGHQDAIPEAYSQGSQGTFSYFTSIGNAWWAANIIMNWMDKVYVFMSGDVNDAQERFETTADELLMAMDIQAELVRELKSATTSAVTQKHLDKNFRDLLALTSNRHASDRAHDWWELAGNLTQKFNDGYLNDPTVGEITGYPAWWLERVGYTEFPKPPPAETCT